MFLCMLYLQNIKMFLFFVLIDSNVTTCMLTKPRYSNCIFHTVVNYILHNMNTPHSTLHTPHSTLHRHYDDAEFCWMEMGPSIFFLAIPALIAILINIFFLCSVVSILRYGKEKSKKKKKTEILDRPAI